jgi:hypothetical protein
MAPVALKAEPRADHGEPVTAAPCFDELPAGLDWAAFSTRRFPARGFPHGRRHDFQAVAAYYAYKQLPAEAAKGQATAEGVEAWEDEGGSTQSPS